MTRAITATLLLLSLLPARSASACGPYAQTRALLVGIETGGAHAILDVQERVLGEETITQRFVRVELATLATERTLATFEVAAADEAALERHHAWIQHEHAAELEPARFAQRPSLEWVDDGVRIGDRVARIAARDGSLGSETTLWALGGGRALVLAHGWSWSLGTPAMVLEGV